MRKTIIAKVEEGGKIVEREITVVVAGGKSPYRAAMDAVRDIASIVTVYGFFHKNADGTKGDKIEE